MKQEAARKEILEKLRIRCNFAIPEYRLSGKTLSSIGSLATVYRHLVALEETLRMESANETKLSSRIMRSVTGRENSPLKTGSASMLGLQDDFQRSLDALSAQIIGELGVEGSTGQGGQVPLSQVPGGVSASIEPLRCPSCGAPLGPPTSKFIRCNYCMTTFEMDDYLTKLATTLHPPGTAPGPST